MDQAVSDIKERILQLSAMDEDDLTNAMAELKAALKENPSAVEILLPEDIGEMVKALRKITGEALATAAAKPKGKPKAKKLTEEELNAALDDL